MSCIHFDVSRLRKYLVHLHLARYDVTFNVIQDDRDIYQSKLYQDATSYK